MERVFLEFVNRTYFVFIYLLNNASNTNNRQTKYDEAKQFQGIFPFLIIFQYFNVLCVFRIKILLLSIQFCVTSDCQIYILFKWQVIWFVKVFVLLSYH